MSEPRKFFTNIANTHPLNLSLFKEGERIEKSRTQGAKDKQKRNVNKVPHLDNENILDHIDSHPVVKKTFSKHLKNVLKETNTTTQDVDSDDSLHDKVYGEAMGRTIKEHNNLKKHEQEDEDQEKGSEKEIKTNDEGIHSVEHKGGTYYSKPEESKEDFKERAKKSIKEDHKDDVTFEKSYYILENLQLFTQQVNEVLEKGTEEEKLAIQPEIEKYQKLIKGKVDGQEIYFLPEWVEIVPDSDDDKLQKAFNILDGKVKVDDTILKGITSSLDYNSDIKFKKSGKDIKESMEKLIEELKDKKVVLLGQIGGLKEKIGSDPTEEYQPYMWRGCSIDEKLYRFPNNICYPQIEGTNNTDYSGKNDYCKYNDLIFQYCDVCVDICKLNIYIRNLNDTTQYELRPEVLMMLGF